MSRSLALASPRRPSMFHAYAVQPNDKAIIKAQAALHTSSDFQWRLCSATGSRYLPSNSSSAFMHRVYYV